MNLLINPIDLKILLESNWKLKVLSISDAPRGFVAETYFVQTQTSEVFVKVINAQSRYIKNVASSMQALNLMYSMGFTSTVPPIHTLNNKPYYLDNSYMIIIFRKIQAVQNFSYAKQKYYRILKLLHDFDTKEFMSIAQKEDFDINFESELKYNLDLLQQDIFMQELLGIDKAYLEKLDKTYSAFKALIHKCKRKRFKAYLTHGDSPGNIIEDKQGNLFLIDWDDLILAPLERDLWYHINQPELQKYYPLYKPNMLFYKYYVLRRYFDDISGFLDEIYNPENSEEKKFEMIDEYKNDIRLWLEPLVNKLGL